MPATVYTIHQTINRPVTFKGLKAQYLVMAGAALVGDLLLFVILYIAGLNSTVDLVIVFGVGTVALSTTYRLSNKYGEFGLMKRSARKKVPSHIKVSSRTIFLQLKHQTNEQ